MIVGRFGLFGAGLVRVDQARLGSALATAKATVQVSVTDRFGAGGSRTFAVTPTKLRDLTLAGITDGVAELKGLAELRDALVAADVAQRPDPAAIPAHVEALVGPGALLDAVRGQVGGAAPAPQAAPAAQVAPAVAPSGGGSLLDELLDAPAPAAVQATASKAVSSMIDALRGGGSAAVSGEVAKQQRAIHRLIDDRLALTAADLLRAPELVALESAWRGLKMVLDECTDDSGVAVDVLERADGDLAAQIDAALPADALERPDLLVIADPLSDLKSIAALADLAEGINAPALIELPSSALGAEDPAQLAMRWDEGASSAEWLAVRDERAARWLFATMNPVASQAEGVGAARRLVTSGSALALAAMLIRSYRLTGAFARIGSGWRGPAVHVPSTGAAAGSAVPTATFLNSKGQGVLARHGIVGLGSARSADEVRLPTVVSASSAPDAVPLPAQILTGRVVRFAQWIRDQLPADADDAVAATMFEQAAGVLVFPGLSETAAISGKIVRDDPEVGPTLVVTAHAHPEVAGVRLQLAFGLPLA